MVEVYKEYVYFEQILHILKQFLTEEKNNFFIFYLTNNFKDYKISVVFKILTAKELNFYFSYFKHDLDKDILNFITTQRIIFMYEVGLESWFLFSSWQPWLKISWSILTLNMFESIKFMVASRNSC